MIELGSFLQPKVTPCRPLQKWGHARESPISTGFAAKIMPPAKKPK
jgi:hypothetical protein